MKKDSLKNPLSLDELVLFLVKKDTAMTIEFVILYQVFVKVWWFHKRKGIYLWQEQSVVVDVSLEIIEQFVRVYTGNEEVSNQRKPQSKYQDPHYDNKTKSIPPEEIIIDIFKTNRYHDNFHYGANRTEGDYPTRHIKFIQKYYREVLYSKQDLTDGCVDMEIVFTEQLKYFNLIPHHEALLKKKILAKYLVAWETLYIPHIELLRDFFARIHRYGGAMEIQAHFDSSYKIIPSEKEKEFAENSGFKNLQWRAIRIESKYDCIKLYNNGCIIWDIPYHPQHEVYIETKEGKNNKDYKLLKELLEKYPGPLIIRDYDDTYGTSFLNKEDKTISFSLSIRKKMERFVKKI